MTAQAVGGRDDRGVATTNLVRLGKLIRLLASEQPGEVIAARDALVRHLAGMGHDLNSFGDMIEARGRSLVIATAANDSDDTDDDAICRAMIDALLGDAIVRRLSAWERDFLAVISAQRIISRKQTIKLSEIFAQSRRKRAAR